MTKITNCLQLRSSKHRKPLQCDYCDGKLLYSTYTGFIKVWFQKNPPVGADDLNIVVEKTNIYKIEYAKCLKCNAIYKVSKEYYCSKYRMSNNVALELVLDIDKDFNSTISFIIKNTYPYHGKNIRWHYTIENHNLQENKIIRFINNFSFFKKLHNAVKSLLTKKRTQAGKIIHHKNI